MSKLTSKQYYRSLVKEYYNAFESDINIKSMLRRYERAINRLSERFKDIDDLNIYRQSYLLATGQKGVLAKEQYYERNKDQFEYNYLNVRFEGMQQEYPEIQQYMQMYKEGKIDAQGLIDLIENFRNTDIKYLQSYGKK